MERENRIAEKYVVLFISVMAFVCIIHRVYQQIARSIDGINLENVDQHQRDLCLIMI